MEIMEGAYRVRNPNALFMLREDSFLDEIPEASRGKYQDNSAEVRPHAEKKLKILKENIKSRFPVSVLL